MGKNDFLVGAAPGLADFHAAPQFGFLVECPGGLALLGEFPNLAAWWERIISLPDWQAAIAES